MTATETVDLFSLDTAPGGRVAGAGAGGESGLRHVRAGDDARDPRRHPATAADGPIDRIRDALAEPGRT